jgi:hypothetical protein
MIVGHKVWKELIRLFSIEGQPTKAALAQTCMGVFNICWMSYTIFATLFFEPACGPLRTTWRAATDNSIRNTDIHSITGEAVPQ